MAKLLVLRQTETRVADGFLRLRAHKCLVQSESSSWYSVRHKSMPQLSVKMHDYVKAKAKIGQNENPQHSCPWPSSSVSWLPLHLV